MSIFKVEGPVFWSQQWCVSDAEGCLRGPPSPLRSWSFFENVGSNEAIWCTIFPHVKHLTACLLRFFFYFRTGWSKKWRGHAPPVWKVEGPLAPLVPPPMLKQAILLCSPWQSASTRATMHHNAAVISSNYTGKLCQKYTSQQKAKYTVLQLVMLSFVSNIYFIFFLEFGAVCKTFSCLFTFIVGVAILQGGGPETIA